MAVPQAKAKIYLILRNRSEVGHRYWNGKLERKAETEKLKTGNGRQIPLAVLVQGSRFIWPDKSSKLLQLKFLSGDGLLIGSSYYLSSTLCQPSEL